MTQTRQLFGTDGIRGVAGEFPLTRDSVYWIGRALGHDLLRLKAKPRVVIGQDTRVSSCWIADRFLQGLTSVGVETRSAGVITTPGVAFLARSRFPLGTVLAAQPVAGRGSVDQGGTEPGRNGEECLPVGWKRMHPCAGGRRMRA